MLDSDPIDDSRADVADLIDQAEPASSEPIEQALEDRDPVGDPDPELTGLEVEEAEDSGQA